MMSDWAIGALHVAMAGLWAEIWRFGLGFGLIILCCLAAYFSPIWKRDFLYAAGAIAIFMFAFTSGVIIGEKRVYAKWEAANAYTVENAKQAHDSAVRTVARKPHKWLPNHRDRYDRDRD